MVADLLLCICYMNTVSLLNIRAVETGPVGPAGINLRLDIKIMIKYSQVLVWSFRFLKSFANLAETEKL